MSAGTLAGLNLKGLPGPAPGALSCGATERRAGRNRDAEKQPRRPLAASPGSSERKDLGERWRRGEGALEGARLAAVSGPRQPEEEKESELTFPREMRGLRRAPPSPGEQVPERPPCPGPSGLRAPNTATLGKQRVEQRAAASP